MAETKKTGGLAGVTAGKTELCTVGKEGAGLTYRGYDIYDLADNVEHWVPRFHEHLVAGPNALAYFKRNYRHRICNDLEEEFLSALSSHLDDGYA